MFVSVDHNDQDSIAIADIRTDWFYSTTKKERLEIIHKARQQGLSDLVNELEKRIDEPFEWF